MKLKLIILSAVVLVFCASQVFAGGGHDHGAHSEEASEDHKGSMMGDMEENHSDLPNVGNAICPVSGEFIASVDDGKGVQIQHNGKIYNVCCKFCAKDFRKNPEKFIKIIEQKLEDGIDPGRDYESDHDEDAEHHEGGHEKSGHEGEEQGHDEVVPKKEEARQDGGHGDHDH